MKYTVSLLTTVPDCQALVNIATSEKESLEFRKTGLQRQRRTATVNASEVETELVSVNAELAVLQTMLGSLPEGPNKSKVLRDLKRAEYKKFVLEDRKENYGVIALLQKEYDIACVDEEIVQTEGFITALNTRMVELG